MKQIAPKITGIIKQDGSGKRPIPDDPDLYIRWLNHFKDGQKVVIDIHKPKAIKKQRSGQENKYYWGVVVGLIADDVGYDDKKEMHEALKYKFLRVDRGNGLPFVRSTASLSTVEFEKYLSDIRMFASTELGVFVPLPNEILPSSYQ